jgi:hypothetical protein
LSVYFWHVPSGREELKQNICVFGPASIRTYKNASAIRLWGCESTANKNGLISTASLVSKWPVIVRLLTGDERKCGRDDCYVWSVCCCVSIPEWMSRDSLVISVDAMKYGRVRPPINRQRYFLALDPATPDLSHELVADFPIHM